MRQDVAIYHFQSEDRDVAMAEVGIYGEEEEEEEEAVGRRATTKILLHCSKFP